jgi:SAM-dependent methyltransferase
MVDAARRRGEELGLENVEYRVLDAEQMDLDDDSVDGVLCRWGYMLMGDPEAALRETRRVLRDGGRLSFSVWASAEENPWAAIGGRALVELGHLPVPQSGDPGIFSLADRERLSEVVTAAGFNEPDIEDVSVEWRFGEADEYLGFLNECAGGIALTLKALPEEEQRIARDKIKEYAAAFEKDGELDLPGVAHNVLTS